MKPIPEPTNIPNEPTITFALSFPEPLWNKIMQYKMKKSKPMLTEEIIISLLESHPELTEKKE